MGHRFAFIKRMTFYFVYLSDWKTKYIEPEMIQFSPIIKSLLLFVNNLILELQKIKIQTCESTAALEALGVLYR